jgi:hypothetical protein
MRQTISGLVAAIAVMIAGAAPALACGYTACAPCGESGYFSPCAQTYVPAYTDCFTGCDGWAYERLADPDTQYYYVNQGPTYSGPGAFAPYPTYRESAVPGWGAYRWYHHYHFVPRHHSYRYGHRMRYGYHYGNPVLRRYD